MVVFGHLTMAVIDRSPSGSVRGTNLLALHPDWSWVGMAAPMPVFFTAAGWANAHATPASSLQRLRTLAGIGATVVAAWCLLGVGEILITHHSATMGDGARIATQPLWFLTAYVPFVASTRQISRCASHIAPFVVTCIAIVAVSDVMRFHFHAPRWVCFPGFFAAWIIAWSIGSWWRPRQEDKAINERLVGFALLFSGTFASVMLVRWAGYSPSLIDAVPGRRSNTTPPTVFTCTASIAQVGLLMMMASSLDTIALCMRSLLHRINSVSVAVYAWHLTALALCAGVVDLGAPMPGRFTNAWWATRPVWYVGIIAVTSAFVFATSRVTGRTNRGQPTFVSNARFRLAIALITFGAAITGLYGPRTLPTAFAMSTGFIFGWALLG